MVGRDTNEEDTWMSRNILSDDDVWKKDHRRRSASHQQGSQDVAKIARTPPSIHIKIESGRLQYKERQVN